MNQSEYTTYRDWKGWSRGLALKASDYRYFDGEIKRAGALEARSILEVGFGSGIFLSWGKSRGIDVVGLEIIPELVEGAAGAGHNVHLWNLVAPEIGVPNPLAGRQFDTVAAWDVLEHLTIDDARIFLAAIAALLPPGGRLILRFPNGESPFSVPVQNGDYTHKMHVTRTKLDHLCIGTNLRVVGYFNAYRVADRPLFAWVKFLVYRFRDLIELTVGFTYYGKRVPLDPVATAILVRE